MAKVRHINLLYTKEANAKRRRLVKIFNRTIAILGVITLIAVIASSVINITRKSVLAELVKSKQILMNQISGRKTDALNASILSNKSKLIEQSLVSELHFDEYYSSGLSIIPSIIRQNNLTRVVINDKATGTYDLRFDDFKKLDNFLKQIEDIQLDDKFKAYKIETITVAEGTPSSSMIQISMQFK